MTRPIAISLSPNAEKDDVLLATRTLLSPQEWFNKDGVVELEKEFEEYFKGKHRAIAVNSGRSALYLILKALEIDKDDEVIIQAFTCVAVPNSVLWLSAKPVYVDIDETYNTDPDDLKRKITPKTKVIIIQHTFGIPAKFDEIKKIADKHDIHIIEDCAHALGSKYKGKKVGTLSKLSFFSFGRDKVLSSVFGGMIFCSDDQIFKRLAKLRDNLEIPSRFWVFQQLFHPVAFAFILPLYNLGLGKFGLGKIILFILQKLRLLSKPVYKTEEYCLQPSIFPLKMPGALSKLARNQLAKLDKYSSRRKRIAERYYYFFKSKDFSLPPRLKGVSWLRFPIRHKAANELYKFAKNKGILLGNWYSETVVPARNMSLAGYKVGSCPDAERFSETVINLPTYPTLTNSQVEEVLQLIKSWEITKQKK